MLVIAVAVLFAFTGVVLGYRQKVLALLPASLACCGILLVAGAFTGISGWKLLTLMAVAVSSIQVGYLFAVFFDLQKCASVFTRKAGKKPIVLDRPTYFRSH